MSTSTSLPDLSTDYPLTADHIAEYRLNGHVLLRGVLTPEEISAYREAIVASAMKHNTETRPMEERDTYGRAFLQIMNLWTLDEGVRQFTHARRLAKIAADLIGCDGIRLYHDQALFKEPGGGHTPWHQDQFYWPLDTQTSITLWMPLVDINQTMGSMSFADRSQETGYIPISDQISDTSEAFFEGFVRGRGHTVSGGGAMKAGDATFHSGWTLHRAPGNVTDRVREVMTVIFYPDGTSVTEPANDFQRADQQAWLGGLPAGYLADGPLNPRLYP